MLVFEGDGLARVMSFDYYSAVPSLIVMSQVRVQSRED